MYSFWDKEAEVYDVPFFAKGDLYAKRHFFMRIEQKDSMLTQFIDQFELHRLLEFDQETGEKVDQNVCVLRGNQIAKEKKDAVSDET